MLLLVTSFHKMFVYYHLIILIAEFPKIWQSIHGKLQFVDSNNVGLIFLNEKMEAQSTVASDQPSCQAGVRVATETV